MVSRGFLFYFQNVIQRKLKKETHDAMNRFMKYKEIKFPLSCQIPGIQISC